MKILHYFLGFPPYRSGGLTKFAYDLMNSQVNDGNEVAGLWPGTIIKNGANPKIKKRRSISKIQSYELINPLPVPLDEGIGDVDAFIRSCDSKIYRDFLEAFNPGVIHVHTLMGMHKEFIDVANDLKIRTIYTSHDYFGLCPKVTLFRSGVCCEDDSACHKCVQCNLNCLSLKNIQILQSPFYRMAKNTALVRMLRKQHRGNYFAEEQLPDMPDIDVEERAKQYQTLREYYIKIYEKIDFVHFNSTVAETVFRKYLQPRDSEVVSITHIGVSDHRGNEHQKGDKLRILFLAPTKPFKGFAVLKTALDELWAEGKRDFELKVFSPVMKPSPYMVINEDGFKQSELAEIFSKTDVLVAPSVWYETFGFTVLEAISYGVPVVVSNHVGAKDIIHGCGFVIQAGNVSELKSVLCNLNEESLEKLRTRIKTEVNLKSWEHFLKELYFLYAGRVCNGKITVKNE